MTGDAPYIMHGAELSYFTGKLEAYFRAKGLPYTLVVMDLRDFRACAKATGVAQMPQVETPEGGWLTDTTDIIAHFESTRAAPRLTPDDPATAFLSLLLEDLFDEWLWRPALYYRWAFAPDARLMSGEIARTLLRDVPAPFALKRRFILNRQKRHFLTQDGVSATTAPQIEQLYTECLEILEPIFGMRDFLFGARPCAADFGLFGPMFRHFSIDPTPARIMRERAPHVLHWCARMWALTPERLSDTAGYSVHDDLAPLFRMAADDYLPYLEHNAQAFAAGHRSVRYTVRGVDWQVPVAPYRVRCLNDLKHAFTGLAEASRATVERHLGSGARLLDAPHTPLEEPGKNRRPADRLWRRA